MKSLGSSILIICLNDSIGPALSASLANSLGLHFASAHEIVEYEIFDTGAVLKKCGLNYYREREHSSLKSVSEYEDSVIYLNYDLFINNLDIFEEVHPLVYLKLPKKKLSPKKDVVSQLAFEERDAQLSKRCDIEIEISGDGNKNVNKILKELKAKL